MAYVFVAIYIQIYICKPDRVKNIKKKKTRGGITDSLGNTGGFFHLVLLNQGIWKLLSELCELMV